MDTLLNVLFGVVVGVLPTERLHPTEPPPAPVAQEQKVPPACVNREYGFEISCEAAEQLKQQAQYKADMQDKHAE